MNFWDTHEIWFLFVITFFPRISLLFTIASSFGLLAWIGWLFTPHLLVAIIATTKYWDTNPVLVGISWIVALMGTMGEAGIVRGSRPR